MTVSRQTIAEPVSEEDVMDVGEYIESQAQDVRGLFERVQYQGGSPQLTNELWAIHCMMNEAASRLAALRAQGCFPPDAIVRPEGSRL